MLNSIRVLGLLAAVTFAASANAQNPTKSTTTVKSSHKVTKVTARAGANSFTQAQARGRIMKAGFTDVSALRKDADGVWHGTAKKDGKTMHVGLDFKGNVTAAR